MVALPSLSMVSEMEIIICKEVDFSLMIDLGSLNCMVLSEISKFTHLIEGFTEELKRVKNLSVWRFVPYDY